MKKHSLLFTASLFAVALFGQDSTKVPISQPLVSHIFTADPSVHVYNGRLYIYPSHDIEAGVKEDDTGAHFDMRDYHVLSQATPTSKVVDHGVALDVKSVAWAKKQMWAPDAAYKNGTFYLYFPVKDKDEVFHIGVATSKKPMGPFKAEKEPIKGSFSIDPCVFKDKDGKFYMYFGGIWGGQLQRWAAGSYDANAKNREPNEEACFPKIARLSDDMKSFAETPRDVKVVDEQGNVFLEKNNDKRFFEAAWVHKYNGKYYFTYSTGDTHFINYAIGDNPYGPFTYKGVVLNPVDGWTNHHSIVQFKGKWYLYYHDIQISGKTHLRNIKVTELKHRPDGSIETVTANKMVKKK